MFAETHRRVTLRQVDLSAGTALSWVCALILTICDLQGQTSLLSVPDFAEVPASAELLQASAQLAHAQSAAEEASLLLASASASSLSLGESIMEGTIADLLQAAAPQSQERLDQTPDRQPSRTEAAIQAEPGDVLMQPVRQQTGTIMLSTETAATEHHSLQVLTDAAVSTTRTAPASHESRLVDKQKTAVQQPRPADVPAPAEAQVGDHHAIMAANCKRLPVSCSTTPKSQYKLLYQREPHVIGKT